MNLSENIIKKVHFIWIGSPFNDSRIVKNLQKWVLVQSEPIEMYLWYDSHFLTPEEIEMMTKALEIINFGSKQKMTLLDIRETLFLRDKKRKRGFKMIYKPSKVLLDEYEYESGLKGRPETGKLFSFIRNWGYATDIMRMIILLNNGGFYFDVDIEPCDISQYRKDFLIKTCPSGFGFGTNDERDIFLSYPLDNNKFYTIITGALYLNINNREGVSLAEKYAKTIERNTKIIRKNEYFYLFLSYISLTIYTTGSMAVTRSIEPNGSPRDLLLGFKENEELGVIHTWFLTPYQMSRMYYLASNNLYAIYSIRYQKKYQSSYIITTDYIRELENVLLYFSDISLSETKFEANTQNKIEKFLKTKFNYEDLNLVNFIGNVIDDAIFELENLEIITFKNIYDCICSDFNGKMSSGFDYFVEQYIMDYFKYFPDRTKLYISNFDYIINCFKLFFRNENVEYNWLVRKRVDFKWYFEFFIKIMRVLYNFREKVLNSVVPNENYSEKYFLDIFDKELEKV